MKTKQLITVLFLMFSITFYSQESKKEKIKLLKEVWKEARYDDFDEQDMLYLAEKLGLKLNEVFDNCGDLIKLNLKKEQDESGNSQLVIVF